MGAARKKGKDNGFLGQLHESTSESNPVVGMRKVSLHVVNHPFQSLAEVVNSSAPGTQKHSSLLTLESQFSLLPSPPLLFFFHLFLLLLLHLSSIESLLYHCKISIRQVCGGIQVSWPTDIVGYVD